MPSDFYVTRRVKPARDRRLARQADTRHATVCESPAWSSTDSAPLFLSTEISTSVCRLRSCNASGGTVGHFDRGDTLTLTYSGPMDPYSILAAWTGAAIDVQVALVDF
jgi:hypothetical protein